MSRLQKIIVSVGLVAGLYVVVAPVKVGYRDVVNERGAYEFRTTGSGPSVLGRSEVARMGVELAAVVLLTLGAFKVAE